MELYPIYIPSKARADSVRTAALLDIHAIKFTIVVEPQDEADYRQVYGDSVVPLPVNDAGIGFARKWIKQLSERRGEPMHFQVDDDVRGFMLRIPGQSRTVITPRVALGEIQGCMDQHPSVHIAGTNQNSFPPRTSTPVVGGLPVQCVLLRNGDGIYHFPDLRLKSDLDYVFQVLNAKRYSVMFDHIRTDSPSGHTAPGGCAEAYQREREYMLLLKSRWPELEVKLDTQGRLQLQKGKFLKRLMQRGAA